MRIHVTEPLFRKSILKNLLEMVCDRDNLTSISGDGRWPSLPATLLTAAFNLDNLAITSESELLSLVERWNANRDKSPEDIIMVAQCFRQTGENIFQLINFLSTLGLINENKQDQTEVGSTSRSRTR